MDSLTYFLLSLQVGLATRPVKGGRGAANAASMAMKVLCAVCFIFCSSCSASGGGHSGGGDALVDRGGVCMHAGGGVCVLLH